LRTDGAQGSQAGVVSFDNGFSGTSGFADNASHATEQKRKISPVFLATAIR